MLLWFVLGTGVITITAVAIIAAIYLAARACGTPLPTRAPWHDVFATRSEDMLAIARDILALHAAPRVGWLPSLRPDWSPRDDEDAGEGPVGGGAGAGAGAGVGAGAGAGAAAAAAAPR